MGKNKATISFDRDFLNNLVEDEGSCVEVKEQNYHLALHPFHLNNINESVKELLNQGIAKFDKKLGGILLGYQDIKLLSSAGVVNNDSFFIHVDVSATFYLFRPEVGKILTGTANKKSEDHVGCLVHRTFNVSLPKPAENDDEDWLGLRVQIGHDILFRITFTNLEARLPYIRAELVSILSEPDSGISTSEENAARKPKRIVFDSDSEKELEISESKKKKKKKKKHQNSENKQEYIQKVAKKQVLKEDKVEEENSSKKKKSKHKYNDILRIKEFEGDENDKIPEIRVKKKKLKDKQSLSKSREMEIHGLLEKSVKKELLNETSEFNDINVEMYEKPLIIEKRKHRQSLGEDYGELENLTKKEKFKSTCSNSFDLMETDDSFSKKIKNSKANPGSTHAKKLSHKAIKVEMDLSEDESMLKRQKKMKHKDTLQELQDAVLAKALLSFGETSSTAKYKKEKKSRKRDVESDADVSLPDLNLSSIFNDKSVTVDSKSMSNFLMADNEDKSVKGRFASTSHTSLYDDKALQLAPDSDLESILNVGTKHKNKSEENIQFVKKRRRSSSSDFEMPEVKRKLH